jgi:hypothetical protein
MAVARPIPVKAPVINMTGLLIFPFLTISRFLPEEHGSLRREADGGRGYFPMAFPYQAKWEPLAPAPKTL